MICVHGSVVKDSELPFTKSSSDIQISDLFIHAIEVFVGRDRDLSVHTTKKIPCWYNVSPCAFNFKKSRLRSNLVFKKGGEPLCHWYALISTCPPFQVIWGVSSSYVQVKAGLLTKGSGGLIENALCLPVICLSSTLVLHKHLLLLPL